MAKYKIAIIDVEKCEQAIEATATAIALQQSVRIYWKEREDLGILGGLALMFYGSSGGTVEIDIGTKQSLQRRIHNLREKYTKMLFDETLNGGEGLVAFTEQLNKIRNKACKDIQGDFAQVAKDNEEIGKIYAKYGNRASAIQYGAGVLLAVLSGGTGVMMAAGMTSVGGIAIGGTGLQFFAVSMGTGVGMTTAENHHELAIAASETDLKDVKAVAMMFKDSAASIGLNASSGVLAGMGFKKASETLAAYSVEFDSMQKLAAQRSKELAKSNVFTRATARKASQEASEELAEAGAKKVLPEIATEFTKNLGRGMPVIFSGLDIIMASSTRDKQRKALGF